MMAGGPEISAVHFVIPPSHGNVAGIERVTLHCALKLQALMPASRVHVHMFGRYRLPAELDGPHVIRHAETRLLSYGKQLRAAAADPRGVWIICQPMTLLALLVGVPGFLLRHTPALIFHGGLHIEMLGWRRQLQFHLFAALARHFHLPLAAVSRALSRYAEVRLRLPRSRVKTLYNPTLKSAQVTTVGGKDRSRFRCIVIGRLHEQKGFDILISAFHEAALGPEAELLIVGDGPQRSLLETMRAQGPRTEQIQLLGHREDVLQQLDKADLFLMPSRYEGLGGTLIEALSRGLPVIATDYPFGAKEALAEGRFGKLIQPPYARGLQRALEHAYQQWKDGRLAQENLPALERHLEKFAIDQAVLAYKAFIRRTAKIQHIRSR